MLSERGFLKESGPPNPPPLVDTPLFLFLESLGEWVSLIHCVVGIFVISILYTRYNDRNVDKIIHLSVWTYWMSTILPIVGNIL